MNWPKSTYIRGVCFRLYMCHVILVTTTPQSAVRSPQFAVRSPQSAVRSPQSAVRSPCLILTGTILDRLNRHKRCLFRQYARRRAFITKTRTVILFTSTTWIALALGKQLLSIFSSETMKQRTGWCTKAILWELNPFPMVTLSLGLCYIFCAQKYIGQQSESTHPTFDLFSRKQRWLWWKRRGYTTCSQTTAFCSYEKSCTFREDMSAACLNAINTDFKL